MPMFYTPKPRQFRYQPRFYDPEKERWEALKQKHADERIAEERAAEGIEASADLDYFERRVREIDRKERHSKGGLTWKDMFRKREMPKFNYQPRFASNESDGTAEHLKQFKHRSTSIKRRFDITDKDYLKPVPAGRIMLYALLVCMLLYWILF